MLFYNTFEDTYILIDLLMLHWRQYQLMNWSLTIILLDLYTFINVNFCFIMTSGILIFIHMKTFYF